MDSYILCSTPPHNQIHIKDAIQYEENKIAELDCVFCIKDLLTFQDKLDIGLHLTNELISAIDENRFDEAIFKFVNYNNDLDRLFENTVTVSLNSKKDLRYALEEAEETGFWAAVKRFFKAIGSLFKRIWQVLFGKAKSTKDTEDSVKQNGEKIKQAMENKVTPQRYTPPSKPKNNNKANLNPPPKQQPATPPKPQEQPEKSPATPEQPKPQETPKPEEKPVSTSAPKQEPAVDTGERFSVCKYQNYMAYSSRIWSVVGLMSGGIDSITDILERAAKDATYAQAWKWKNGIGEMPTIWGAKLPDILYSSGYGPECKSLAEAYAAAGWNECIDGKGLADEFRQAVEDFGKFEKIIEPGYEDMEKAGYTKRSNKSPEALLVRSIMRSMSEMSHWLQEGLIRYNRDLQGFNDLGK